MVIVRVCIALGSGCGNCADMHCFRFHSMIVSPFLLRQGQLLGIGVLSGLAVFSIKASVFDVSCIEQPTQ